MGTYNGLSVKTNFSNDDMLADIDAMNMAKIYLDNNYLVSKALKEYYSSTDMDNGQGENRYKKFINSVSLETRFLEGNPIIRFKNEVYYAMALVTSFSVASDMFYPAPIYDRDVLSISPTYALLKGGLIGGSVPEQEYRIACADQFINYILEMSTPPLKLLEEKSIHFNCESLTSQNNQKLFHEQMVVYKINIDCYSRYRYNILGKNDLIIELTNSLGHKYLNFKDNQDYIFDEWLEKGQYTLKIKSENPKVMNHITFRLESMVETIVNIEKDTLTDVKTHLHKDTASFTYTSQESTMSQIVFMFKEKENIVFPNGKINIKDKDFNLIKTIDFYECKKNGNNSNISYIQNKVFTKYEKIYIEYEEIDCRYTEITIKVEDIDSIDLNNDDRYENQIKVIPGSLMKKWTIIDSGKYAFSFKGLNTDGSSSNIKIYKRNADNTINYIIYRALKIPFIYEVNLYKGEEIYFGYENGDCVGELQIEITRLKNVLFELISDPIGAVAGSEVTINNGLNNGLIVTKGFTRSIYLSSEAPTQSRLSYIWQVSNSQIASVTEYGTVTGKKEGQVVIRAFYKQDLTIIGEITFQIIEDEKREIVSLSYGMDVRIGGTISGSEVTSGLGIPIEVKHFEGYEYITMHKYKTRLICLGTDSPSQNIQDFNWLVNQGCFDEGLVSVSSYGTITGTKEGGVLVQGTYIHNTRFKVYIYLQVIV